ncbi:MAG: MBL fold metallo-hydrolase [Oleibacter sp.]|nr:MBL fold metallo-hydrolase [Thalassolituus sp.]
MSIDIKSYFHEDTSTFTHLLCDLATSQCAIIDPVLGYDHKAGRTDTAFIDNILDDIKARCSTLMYVLETHAHADHLSSAAYLRQHTGAKVVIGHGILGIQQCFAEIFNEQASFLRDGSQFDRLLNDGETLMLGETCIQALATPGHTPACMSYLVNDSDVFVGDTLFPPDIGSARCDFPGGDASVLYDSAKRLLALGDDVVMHMCHDYPKTDRAVRSSMTVAEQRRDNIHVGEQHHRENFIELRTSRDKTLAMPMLILPALQVNIRAGDFPEPESNGVAYLKVPVNLL